MDFLPFEIYSAPFDKDKYGMVFEIPNYCTEKELEIFQDTLQLKTNIAPDVYPNQAFNLGWHTEKSQIIYKYIIDIFEYYEKQHPAATYGFSYVLTDNHITNGEGPESCKFILNERVQGSPIGMRMYPPHTDNGKLITILVPLSPVESVPTTFHGLDGKQSPVTIPWKINHAYLFCASLEYSWHSYVGDKYHDRWIVNMNIFQEIGGFRKRPFNLSNVHRARFQELYKEEGNR